MLKIIIDNKPTKDWNDYLKKSELGSVYQTKEWGEYGKAHLSANPIYVTFFDGNRILAQLLMFQTIRGRSKILKLFGRGFLYKQISNVKILPKHFFWNFGPVIFDTKFQNEVSNSLGNLLKSWKSTFKGTSHPLMQNFSFDKKFNFKQNKEGTFIISLNKNINDILKETDKKSVQKNIKRSQERGVKITQIKSEKDLVSYYQLLKQFRIKNKLVTYSLENIIDGYNLLKETGHIGFLAWHNDILIGGVFISTFNNFINEWGIVSSDLDRENKLYCTDLLRWKIIEWGTQNNYKYYDLSGIKLFNRSQKEDGIYRNKKKWGGSLIEYNSFQSQ